MTHATLRRNTRTLPHQVGTAEIGNAELKKVAMQFMENFKALNERVGAVEAARAAQPAQKPDEPDEPDTTEVRLSVYTVLVNKYGQSGNQTIGVQSRRLIYFAGDGEDVTGGVSTYARKADIPTGGSATVAVVARDDYYGEDGNEVWTFAGIYDVLVSSGVPTNQHLVSEDNAATISLSSNTALYAYYISKPIDDWSWANTVCITSKYLGGSVFDYIPMSMLLSDGDVTNGPDIYVVTVHFINYLSGSYVCTVKVVDPNDPEHYDEKSVTVSGSGGVGSVRFIDVSRYDHIYIDNKSTGVDMFVKVEDYYIPSASVTPSST